MDSQSIGNFRKNTTSSKDPASNKHKGWALLIGVDSYIPGKERPVEFKNLKGCVRDVLAMRQYLQNLGVQNIKILTASGDPGPVEDETELPIYNNVKRELEHITENAQPGDLIYIHYSGHGIRRDALGVKQRIPGDQITGTALALANVMKGGAYLTGYQLGVWVKRMVRDKNLRVTLVLDSCFSGRGFRNSEHYAVRTVEDKFDDSLLQSDKDADEVASAADMNTPGDFRNAHVKRSWLSNPTGCTVLTACEFDEVAGEDNFPGMEGKHGVLTYWVLQGLGENHLRRRPTYTKIKEYVRSKITHMKPTVRQSPVLHGDGDYLFFGRELVVERPACNILSRYDNYVDLDIGTAQGVSVGAVYDVYPEKGNIDVETIPTLQAHIMELSELSAFRSTAVIFIHEAGHITPLIDKGGTAVLRKWALPSDTYVNVSLLNRAGLEVRLLEAEIEQTPGLYLHSDTAPSDPAFDVVFDRYNNFEIQENGKRLSRIPKLSVEDDKWRQRLAYLLSHLARFRAIEALPNNMIDDPLPCNWFSFKVQALSGQLVRESNGRYNVTEGQRVVVSFRLKEECPLEYVYVSFFGLHPSWGIRKLHPGPGQFAFKTSRSRLERFGISMEIPPGRSDDPVEINDIIRVFISTNEASWEEIALPDLPVEGSFVPLESEGDVALSVQDPDAESLAARNSKSFSMGEEKWGVMDIIIHTSRDD
jgi:hypothetical protein